MFKNVLLSFFLVILINNRNLYSFSLKKNNLAYEVTYKYISPSLGPVEGYSLNKVILYNKKIISIIDLTTGRIYKNKYKNGTAELIRKAFYNIDISNNYDVSYKNSYPFLIQPKQSIGEGGYFEIEILKYKILNRKNLYFNSNKEIIDLYNKNYNKWFNYQIAHYGYIYNNQFDKYQDGIYVEIINNRVKKAVDIFSQNKINLNRSFYTITNLFKKSYKIINNRYKCEDFRVIYDTTYGFPAYIKCKYYNISIFSYGIKKLN